MDLNAAVERWVGIAEYAREAGWILESRLFAFLSLGQREQYLASTRVDGILSMVRKADPGLREVVANADVPVVDLWQYHPEFKVPRVLPDHEAAGHLAADHLMDLGLKRLLFYSHAIDRLAIRRDGFRDAARARGVKIDEIWWDSQTPVPEGLGRVGWLAGQLKAFAHPLGVMAGNDVVASDVLDAAEYAGLRVPEDVAVIGVDNHPILAELGAIPLTSVDIARARVGYEAAALLDRMIDGEKPPQNPILVAPAGVVTRRSTQMLAVSDPDIIEAIRFIQEHFREPITVTDVAAKTFLSRRRLQDRFHAALGHGMSEEITRQRLEFSKHLLMQSEHKISSIATMAGFASLDHLGKVFRRELGTTPQAYRQAYHPAFNRGEFPTSFSRG